MHFENFDVDKLEVWWARAKQYYEVRDGMRRVHVASGHQLAVTEVRWNAEHSRAAEFRVHTLIAEKGGVCVLSGSGLCPAALLGSVIARGAQAWTMLTRADEYRRRAPLFVSRDDSDHVYTVPPRLLDELASY